MQITISETERMHYVQQGQRLRIYRKSKNWTQQDLAAILNKTQGTLYKYETGLTDIPSADIRKLHNEYGLSYSWFYDNVGDMENIKNIIAPGKGNTDKNLLAMYEQLEARFNKLERDYRKLIGLNKPKKQSV